MKLLLVEDDDDSRDMLSRRLKLQGFQVVTATTGLEGLSLAESEVPAIILMDMSLPVLDGWETARRIKANEQTRRIPVIALTAHAMPADRVKAMQAGCDDFDTMPHARARIVARCRR
jgi:two-component system, cell cycle response regulator DivK